MDTEQAKFILASYRPDGADAQEETFTEALALAAQDRELERWLSAERTHDAAFANALADTPVPADLREKIFSAMDTSNQSPDIDALDAEFIGALTQVQPPAGLRDQILTALDVEEKVIAMPRAKRGVQIPWLSSLAIAAAIAIAALFAFNLSGRGEAGAVAVNEFSLAGHQFIRTEFDKATLDVMDPDLETLYAHLENSDSFGPNAVPSGLAEANGVGCKVIEVDGVKASLVCYELNTGEVVHVITVNRADIEGDLPSLTGAGGACYFCPADQWAMTNWEDGDKAHFAFTRQLTPEQLSGLF